MEAVESTYKDAKRSILLLRSQLAQLATGQDTSIFLQGTLATGVKTLSELSSKLQEDVKTVPGSKRDLWMIKVQQVVSEQYELRKAIEGHFYEINKEAQEEEERRKLFGDREPGQQTYMGEELKLWMDMSSSITRSQRLVQEMHDIANNIVHVLVDDQSLMKKLHRKVMDIVNTFETARSVMRMIEKRQYTDRMIVFGGMFVIMLFLVIAWWYKIHLIRFI